jgi:DNA-binding transcriptional ArsR family regulator
MDTFLALAEPTRRNIMEMLVTNGSLTASDIYSRFQATPPAISQHLKVLREANLVRVEKRAQKRIYYVNQEPMKDLENWIKRFTQDMQERHDRLETLLQEQMVKLENKKEKNNG